MSLLESASAFLNSDEPNVQLDIFSSKDNLVLLQAYHYHDVVKWGIGINFGDVDGIVLELRFKINGQWNDLNYERFTNSKYYFEFQNFNSTGKNSFFKFVPTGATTEEFTSIIVSILKDVYKNYNNISYSVAAY